MSRARWSTSTELQTGRKRILRRELKAIPFIHSFIRRQRVGSFVCCRAYGILSILSNRMN